MVGEVFSPSAMYSGCEITITHSNNKKSKTKLHLSKLSYVVLISEVLIVHQNVVLISEVLIVHQNVVLISEVLIVHQNVVLISEVLIVHQLCNAGCEISSTYRKIFVNTIVCCAS